ncbi:MAG: beta-ketoacyl-ACP synthase II [Candidatus Dadabacteria bacterium]|nr:beta-ketoacyl-ACP synthase II [Candidatus Dadabacteria bacterium]
MDRRVVITGIGLVTPLGVGKDKSWNTLCCGKSGIGRIQKFDPSALKTQIAGEVLDFSPQDYMEPKEVRRSDPFIHFAIAATKLALEDASLEVTEELSPRVGTFVSSGIGGLESFCKNVVEMHERGPSRVSPFFIPSMIANMAAGYVSIYYNAKGPSNCTTTACAASAHAIGDSSKIISRGDADVMIAGGTEAPLIPVAIAGFNNMKVLSKRNDEPERASRPFDKERDGFIMGEGSGILILEELEFARKRGARIYAEVLGYGMSSDAHHITAPSLDGPVRCVKSALRDSKLSPDQIDYINAHGTSTTLNDANETQVIKEIFGPRAYKIPISSTKSMTGHLLGAAGGVEGAFTVLALVNGVLPPTINQEYPDPECDLDYVPNEARDEKIKIALTNSFGFGGTNVSIALRKFDG